MRLDGVPCTRACCWLRDSDPSATNLGCQRTPLARKHQNMIGQMTWNAIELFIPYVEIDGATLRQPPPPVATNGSGARHPQLMTWWPAPTDPKRKGAWLETGSAALGCCHRHRPVAVCRTSARPLSPAFLGPGVRHAGLWGKPPASLAAELSTAPPALHPGSHCAGGGVGRSGRRNWRQHARALAAASAADVRVRRGSERTGRPWTCTGGTGRRGGTVAACCTAPPCGGRRCGCAQQTPAVLCCSWRPRGRSGRRRARSYLATPPPGRSHSVQEVTPADCRSS